MRIPDSSFPCATPTLVLGCNAWNYDEYGGAYKIATDLAVFCAERGWDVHYVSSHPKGNGKYPDTELGVKVWRYLQPTGSGKGKSLGNLWGHLSQAREIMRTIRNSVGHDYPLVINGHSPLQYLGLITASGKSTPSHKVMSVHSPTAKEFIAEKDGARLQLPDHGAIWLLKKIESVCYQKSDKIQCDSNFTRLTLAQDFPKQTGQRMVVCPGYVDLDKFTVHQVPRSQVRQQLGDVWKTEDIIFFTLRRHVERMGIGNLIKACAWLREKISNSGLPNFRLIIGGDGPLRKQLEALKRDLKLDDYVYFVGRLPEENLELAYRAANCFVLPTRGLECFGLIILESFAAGTPVIATPVGSIPEVLGPFAQESLTENTEPEAIGKAMLDFMIHNKWQDREHELYQHAKMYDKKIVLQRLEKILIED